MTKQEFLDEVGLSREEFRDLVEGFNHFLKPLNKAQRGAVRRSMPTVAEAASSLGPDITPDQLEKTLAGILKGIEFVMSGCHYVGVTNLNPRRSIAPHQPKSRKLK